MGATNARITPVPDSADDFETRLATAERAYLFRSLPTHAVRAGTIDELLADPDYVLHTDLHLLIPAATTAVTPAGVQRAHLLRLTPQAIATESPERLAMLSVTETLDSAFRHHRQDAPYRGLWANALHRQEQAVLKGHTDWVNGVCAVRVGDRELLASASTDRTVRLWDPATGQALHVIPVHYEAVGLASLGDDCLVVGLSPGLLALSVT